MEARSDLILVVEDEVEIRETIVALLEKENFEVHSAADGKTALEKLQSGSQPLLIICDINMPKMNGMDFIRHSLTQLQQTNVVMLTAYAEKERIIEALQLGALDYIVKPFDPQAFIKKVYTLIEIAKHRTEKNKEQARNPAQSSRMEALHRIRNSRA